MNDKKYTKCFYNGVTDATYKTLKAAIESSELHYVCRCWMLDGKIQALCPICISKSSVRTIKNADKAISTALKNGTVGRRKKNKFFVD